MWPLNGERRGVILQIVPRVGDVVYVDTDLYVHHGRDDFRGGKGTVCAVRAEPGVWIEIEQNPGMQYNWKLLEEQQENLKGKFGEQWAHADPDLRAEFNDNGW
jgi:hypothetical protein